MWRLIASCCVIALAACSSVSNSSVSNSSDNDSFVVLFVSGKTEIPPEARLIVGRAAENAKAKSPYAIEIAVSPDAPGGAHLFEPRVSAIQNILSTAGVDAKLSYAAHCQKLKAVFPERVAVQRSGSCSDTLCWLALP